MYIQELRNQHLVRNKKGNTWGSRCSRPAPAPAYFGGEVDLTPWRYHQRSWTRPSVRLPAHFLSETKTIADSLARVGWWVGRVGNQPCSNCRRPDWCRAQWFMTNRMDQQIRRNALLAFCGVLCWRLVQLEHANVSLNVKGSPRNSLCDWTR